MASQPGTPLGPRKVLSIMYLLLLGTAHAQFYLQGFGSPTVARTLPLFGVYWQDSWAPWSNLTLNYGVRYDLNERYLPLTTDYNNVAPVPRAIPASGKDAGMAI
jgi:hypothetical protein